MAGGGLVDGRRRHVDDAPGALLDHRRQRCLAAEEHALEVDGEDAIELGLLGAHQRAAQNDPGDVGHDVEPAQLADGASDELLDLRHQRRRLVQPGFVDVGDGDTGARFGEHECRRPSDAAGGTGHDRHPPVEAELLEGHIVAACGGAPMTRSPLRGEKSAVTLVRSLRSLTNGRVRRRGWPW